MPTTPDSLLELEAACAEVVEAWAGALLHPSTDADADVRGMSDDGLVRSTEALARLGRRVEALQARCAAGVAERSRGDVDSDLARQRGFSSPERLIAQATGGRYADAARLVAVGQSTGRRATFSGASLPPRHAHVARGMDDGSLCVAAADLIRRFLDGLATGIDRDQLDATEQLLVDRAPIVGIDGLTRLIKQLTARLDPEGVKPREDALRANRSLSIWEDAAGMINLKGAFDPINGAPIKLAIETLVGADLHRARDAKRPFGETDDGLPGDNHRQVTDAATAEVRTIAQMNADALADIARCALASADAPPALRSATVVARIDIESFRSGDGYATLDGIDHPVSTASILELAASAGVAPILMHGGREVLELGRAARLFSPAQKVALVQRDGGCAFPECLRPPSHSQAHHIAWWKRDKGRTDLSNGIMLCSHHHHRVHDDGWAIVVRDGRSWFIPPAYIDPDQRPRAGNVAAGHLISEHLARFDGQPHVEECSRDHGGDRNGNASHSSRTLALVV